MFYLLILPHPAGVLFVCFFAFQVGLAFLAGLGFSLVMIPVNRFLANKIGELSQTMMEKKDGRVKVRKCRLHCIVPGVAVVLHLLRIEMETALWATDDFIESTWNLYGVR